MADDLQPLPVQLFPEDGESGWGFVLRSAHANRLSVPVMMQMASGGEAGSLSDGEVLRLAYVIGVSPLWLSSRLPRSRKIDGDRVIEWSGMTWASVLSLRRSRPQFCPQCLMESPVCKAAWDMSGAFACLRHRRLLCEACPHCRRPLSWRRPAVDVCHCGHYLSGVGLGEALSTRELDWCARLLNKVGPWADSMVPRTEMPQWLDGLTADGMLAVVHAFGVYERCGAPTKGEAAKPPSPARMQAIVKSGLSRLSYVEDLRSSCPPELRALCHEEELERLWTRTPNAVDRRVVRQLLDWLQGAIRTGLSVTGKRARRQLDFFR